MQGIDLFSGAGGMSVGATACGIDVKYAVEIDPYAAATYRFNHKEVHVIQKDIRKVSSQDFSTLLKDEPLVFLGGPPCQGFSTSNQKNRNLGNTNNWLFQEYLRLVCEVKPDWVVFENVKGLLETENGFFLDAILMGFKKAGYSTSHFILNSVNYGIPQKRNRLFIIASLAHKNISVPVPISPQNRVTVGDALRDLPKLKNGSRDDVKKYSQEASTEYSMALRQNLNVCHNNCVTMNAPYVVERYSHIPQGGNWENIPSHLMKSYKDVTRCHTGIYYRLREDEPSIVIGNYRKNMLIHPWEDRGLSVREAARLQSFPDSFVFMGSIGFQQQQVGNAVPPILAKVVLNQILSN